MLKKLFPGRLATAGVLFRVFFILSFFIRILLLIKSAGSFSYAPADLAAAFLTGLFFDLITFGYFIIPYLFFILIVPPKISATKVYRGLVYFFFSLTITLLVFNCIAEYFFWDEFEVRFNFIAVDYLIYTTEVIGNIRESYPLPVLFGGVALVSGAVLYFIFRKRTVQHALKSAEPFKVRVKYVLAWMIIPFAAYFTVDLTWSNISANVYNRELSKNGIYSLFEAFTNSRMDYDRFYAVTDDKAAFSTARRLIADDGRTFKDADAEDIIYSQQADGVEKRYNVMLICVESLSGEYMSYIKEPDEYETPFLDSLTEQSLFFTNMYANGTRTVRGLEAINLSIPPTPGTSIVRRPGNDRLYSMGTVFESKGYINNFVYGGFGYFDNMSAFFGGNGYRIIDRNVFKKEEITFANVWGTCDGDSYRRAIKEADAAHEQGKPFLNYIMTTSNHRPYTFPDVGITLVDNRQGGVKYTDYAIREFLRESKSHAWYDSTIFVIVADHCGSSSGKTELPVLKYQIPCIIYAPSIIKPAKIDKLCGQVDVLPTILALLNWNYSGTFYGKNILTMKKEDERAFIGTYQKLGYIRDNKLLILSPQKKVNAYTFDRYNGAMNPAPADKQMETEAVSLYQAAEHSFMQGKLKMNLKMR